MKLRSAHLTDLIARLPHQPGVYLFKNTAGKIVYVGKANNLYQRVRSYFTQSGDDRYFVAGLDRLLGDIETIITANEKEALLLESCLIKQHKPAFNVMLRDDKNFLVLRLDPRTAFPRLEVTRTIRDDGARYFGPFHSAASCRETLRIVNRYFQLRTCTDRTLATRTRPCLQFQIGRCLAPCVLTVDRDLYAKQIDDVTLFLRGKRSELSATLTQRMERAAERLEFEQAARIRDQIAAIERSLQPQQVVSSTLDNVDLIGFYREGSDINIALLTVRDGKVMACLPFSFSGQEFPSTEIVSAFVSQFYERANDIPPKIALPFVIDDHQVKEGWLAENAGHTVTIKYPQRGPLRKLFDLAQRNAQSQFTTRRKRVDDLKQALTRLQSRLHLPQFPRRIECYDISHWQGDQVVGSMVVMIDGELAPKDYRKFKLAIDTNDDFAALYAVLCRRFRRAAQPVKGWTLPDLIVIDGGKGQLATALAALKDSELADRRSECAIIGLAKERNTPDQAGEERPDRIFLAHVKEPIRFRFNTTELFLLSRLRDEAHRFALTFHRSVRSKRTMRSTLEAVPGIGEKRQRLLLRHLKSLKRIESASYEELIAVPGMSAKAAESVVRYFGSLKKKNEEEER